MVTKESVSPTRVIEIDEQITVGALAELLLLPATRLIGELFKNGVLATINEKIDFDTAQIIVSELDLDVSLKRRGGQDNAPVRAKRQAGDKAQPRPPVVAVMGHVDHGKTSLLDAIRGAKVVEDEAGGITQHISAYQVHHNGRPVTFLDTPGHEAFAALREHGAQLTDLVIIVVAADDGIKPQTLEAIRFAKKAGVKMVVAANKMDKPEADLNRLKQQLAENELMPEDWGGETIVLPVSAKTKEGLNELLDMVLLVTDIAELKADVNVPAQGLIIESHMEKGRGPVAIALVEHGVLKPGVFVTAGATYAKIRNLESTDGRPLGEAGPSMPVIITGFKALPEFGDEFSVQPDEKAAKARALEAGRLARAGSGSNVMSGGELLRIISRSHELQEFKVVIKADVQGSLTSVVDSLKTLDNDEVVVRVVGSGVGVITEKDVHLAATTGALIYGFQVELPASIKRLAARDKVPVRLFRVIYELIDDVKTELETLLSPEIVETELGVLEVKGVFKVTKTEVICGGQVKSGKLTVPALARVRRGKELIAQEVEVVSLKRGPQETKEVVEGEMCGLSFRSAARVEVQLGDRIELFSRQTRQRSL